MRRLAWIALLALAACHGCRRRAAPRSAPAPALGPVEAPAELAAEAVILAPDRSYRELRSAVAQESALLPASIAGLCAGALGLPIAAAQQLDERLPIFAALGFATPDGAGPPMLAAAIHVKDGAELLLLMASGSDAAFEAEPDAKARLTWLKPRASAREPLLPSVQLALVGHYLVAGNDRAAVATLGPYLARTLPARYPGDGRGASSRSGPDLTLHAAARLAGPLGAAIDRFAAWLGATALFGAMIDSAATRKLGQEALSAPGGVSLDASLSQGELAIDATARIAVPDAPAPLDPLFVAGLVDDTVAAVALAENAADRAGHARASSARIAAALPGIDRDALSRALADLAGARGERTALGIRCTGAGVTGYAVGDVGDRARLGHALDALLALGRAPSAQKALERARLAMKSSTGRLEKVPFDVTLLRLARGGGQAVDLRYALGRERFYAAAGADTVPTLQDLVHPDADRTFGASERAAIAALPAHAWLLAVADLNAIESCRAGVPGSRSGAPLTLSVGPGASGVRIQLRAVGLLPLLARFWSQLWSQGRMK